jgi:hypothetical protein
MKAKEFPEVNLRIAEKQEEYMTLPVHHMKDDYGTVVCCMELSAEERKQVAETGEIWVSFLTFNKAG